MFKVQDDQVAVLGICVDPPAMVGRSAELNFQTVHTGRRSIDMLRVLSFDFLLVGLKLPDMSTWDFLRHLKTALPQQKSGACRRSDHRAAGSHRTHVRSHHALRHHADQQ